MSGAIFLSAGVPDPKRGPEFAATAEVPAITAAVSAIVYVTLGRRRLVWGGHPAITPMVWVVAQEMGVDYAQWVHLYQSKYFNDDFPEENARFRNVTFTQKVPDDRDASLVNMREQMLSENTFEAAVFIGGMAGVIDEFEMFRRYHPTAIVLPVMSTGGAALHIGRGLHALPDDVRNDLDYVALFHRHLGISVREERFRRPEDQPLEMERRYWRPPAY